MNITGHLAVIIALMGKTHNQADCQSPLGLIGRLRSQSAAPRDYAKDARAELLAELAGIELAPFQRPPAGDELLAQIATNELDQVLNDLKPSSRKGLKAEKGKLQATLLTVASQRADEMINTPRAERRTTLFSPGEVELAVLSNTDPGPINEALWGRVSAETGLGGISSPEVLALMTSEHASEQARQALDTKLGRLARSELLEISGKIEGRWARPSTSDKSEVCGYLKRSSNGLLLHLLDNASAYSRTVCGKNGPYKAERGAWETAQYGRAYRRCRKCEKLAEQPILAAAQAESKSQLPSGLSAEDRQAIINAPEVRDALLAASTDQQLFDDLKEHLGLQVRIVEQLNEPGKKLINGGILNTAILNRISRSKRADLRDRGYANGQEQEEVSYKDILSTEALASIVDQSVAWRAARLARTGQFREISESIDKLIIEQVEEFIDRTPFGKG